MRYRNIVLLAESFCTVRCPVERISFVTVTLSARQYVVSGQFAVVTHGLALPFPFPQRGLCLRSLSLRRLTGEKCVVYAPQRAGDGRAKEEPTEG